MSRNVLASLTSLPRLVRPAIHRRERGEVDRVERLVPLGSLAVPAYNVAIAGDRARVIKCNQGTECSELPAFSSRSLSLSLARPPSPSLLRSPRT